MSLARASSITGSWLVLVGITIVSVGLAEYGGDHGVSVGIVMAITALKAGLILVRFMDLRVAPAPIRYYLSGWVAGCAIMIAGLYWAGT